MSTNPLYTVDNDSIGLDDEPANTVEVADPEPARRIALTVFESRTANMGVRYGFSSLAEIHGYFARAREATKQKLEMPTFLAGSTAQNRRGSAAVDWIHLLVYDIDNTRTIKGGKPEPLPPEQMSTLASTLECWRGVRALAVTSFSHEPAHPKFRLLIDLSRSATSLEFPALWRSGRAKLLAAGHRVDESACDAGRLWFLPATRPGREFVCEYQDGDPVDVDVALRDAPPPPDAPNTSPTRLSQFLDMLASRISMPDLVRDEGIELTQRGSCWMASSPFRDDGVNASFAVYEDHAFDFVTSEFYGPVRFVQERRGISFKVAVDLVSDRAGLAGAERLIWKDAGKPAVVDPGDAFAALPEALPESGRGSVLSAFLTAVSTLDEPDQTPWIERLRSRYPRTFTRAELARLMRQQAREEEPAQAPSVGEYRVHEGRISAVRTSQMLGEVVTPLCNFDGKILRVITHDDGVDKRSIYEVAMTPAGAATAFLTEVDAAEFEALKWISPDSGTRCWVGPGASTRDQLRVALHHLSAPEHIIRFGQVGWRKIDGEWAYLHAGGAVGRPSAQVTHVELGRGGKLDRFRLPDSLRPRHEALERAVHNSLKLIECGPPEAMYPLYCSAVASPLASMLPLHHVLALIAPPASFKSSVALEFQRFFGDFQHEGHFPLNFESSPTAAEITMSVLADSLAVMDDFRVRSDRGIAERQRHLADVVIRSIGNRQSRERASSRVELQTSRPPRCNLWMTCEIDPSPADQNESGSNRLLKIWLSKDAIQKGVLAEVQREGRHSIMMRGYLDSLTVFYPTLLNDLAAEHAQVRDELRQEKGLLDRQPDMIASLLVSFRTWFRCFAAAGGYVTFEEARRHQERAKEALLSVSTGAAAASKVASPIAQWIDVLRGGLAAGRYHLAERASPLRTISETLSDFGTATTTTRREIGWRGPTHVWLHPASAHGAVVALLREQQSHMPMRIADVFRGLVERGHATPGTEPGRVGTRRDVGGGRERVIELPVDLFDGVDLDRERRVPPLDEELTVRADLGSPAN